MERAVIAFSFDDGRLDNYTNAYPILKKYQLPATFNITSGYIKQAIDRELYGFPEPMNVQMVRELFSTGLFEIAGHGCQHINTIDDIITGIKDLCSFLDVEQLDNRGNGFASPGSDLTEEMYNEIKDFLHENSVRYVRVSCRYMSYRHIKIILRKVSRIVKWPIIYKLAYQDTLMNSIDNNIVYSIPVLSSATPAQIKSIILSSIKQSKACVLMFHSIVPNTQIKNTWDYSKDSFEEICKMLSEFQNNGKLEVRTVMDIHTLLTKI